MRYLVSYDLHRHKDYRKLLATLLSMGAVKIHQSLWGLDTSLPERALLATLTKAVDADDSVLVMLAPPANRWASVRLDPPAVAYLSGTAPSFIGLRTPGLSNLFS